MREVIRRRERSLSSGLCDCWVVVTGPGVKPQGTDMGLLNHRRHLVQALLFKDDTEMCREVGHWLISPDQTDENLMRPVRNSLGLRAAQWSVGPCRTEPQPWITLRFYRVQVLLKPRAPHHPSPALPARTSRKFRDTCSSLTTE